MSNHVKFILLLVALFIGGIAYTVYENKNKSKVAKISIYDTIEKRIKDFSLDTYHRTTEGTLAAANELLTLRILIESGLKDSVYAKDVKRWQAMLGEKQVEAYPTLRQRWVEQGKANMRENDIEVSVSGKDNSVVTFVGDIFATEEAPEVAFRAIEGEFNNLRFKQVRYKSKDGQYTTYTLKTNNDSDVSAL